MNVAHTLEIYEIKGVQTEKPIGNIDDGNKTDKETSCILRSDGIVDIGDKENLYYSEHFIDTLAQDGNV